MIQPVGGSPSMPQGAGGPTFNQAYQANQTINKMVQQNGSYSPADTKKIEANLKTVISFANSHSQTGGSEWSQLGTAAQQALDDLENGDNPSQPLASYVSLANQMLGSKP